MYLKTLLLVIAEHPYFEPTWPAEVWNVHIGLGSTLYAQLQEAAIRSLTTYDFWITLTDILFSLIRVIRNVDYLCRGPLFLGVSERLL